MHGYAAVWLPLRKQKQKGEKREIRFNLNGKYSCEIFIELHHIYTHTYTHTHIYIYKQLGEGALEKSVTSSGLIQIETEVMQDL